MDSELFIILLPILLAFIMLGLGLETRLSMFLHMMQRPKIVFLTLITHIIFLPCMAFLLCITLNAEPYLSVGLMLLAASPSAATSSFFSAHFKANIALNINLTVLSSIISLFTLPFVINISLHYFIGADALARFPRNQILLLCLATILPVILGILIRLWRPIMANQLARSIRILAPFFLISLLLFATLQELSNLKQYIRNIGMACALFCFCSFFAGYIVPQLARIQEAQARACAFHMGIHNTAIPMTIAISIFHDTMLAVPAGLYTLFMFSFAGLFGLILSNRARHFILGNSHLKI